MIGIILVTHGRLAEEFLAAAEHVVGKQTHAEAICIAPDDDVESRRADIEAAVVRVNQGEGVVLLTDMFGGTPSNLAISLMGQPGIEVMAGINLPCSSSSPPYAAPCRCRKPCCKRRMRAVNTSTWRAIC